MSDLAPEARTPLKAEVDMLAVEIVVAGRIDQEWCEWLGGLEITYSDLDQTILKGFLPDQSAVYGVIARMRDLGFSFSSVKIEMIREDGN